jgi:hypothetical protein
MADPQAVAESLQSFGRSRERGEILIDADDCDVRA